jgi:Fic family protein
MINEYNNMQEYNPKFSPVRHKRKVPFSPSAEVTAEFAHRIQRIRGLDFELNRYILTEKDYSELVMDAYSSNIHWSTKVEGNPLSEDEVKRITRATMLSGNIEKRAGPSQEVINHLLVLAGEEALARKWDKKFLCALHEILLEGTGSKAKIGGYRENQAVIEEGGEEVFIACPPGSIEEEMESLLDWVNKKAPAYDVVVAATLFFHEFESIHPFEDGNGRLGRTLFHIYLVGHGLRKSNLCKIDYEILGNTRQYYSLLAYTDESGDYEPLVEAFSLAVLRSYERTIESFSDKDLLSSNLDEISKTLIAGARQRKEWFNVKDAVEWVDEVGEQTVRNRLNGLADMGVLEKMGKTKGLKFRFKIPFSTLKKGAGQVFSNISEASKCNSGNEHET